MNLLLQLADLFEIAPAELAEDDESQLTADVMEVLSNDLFDDLDLTNTDVQELVTASPGAIQRFLARTFPGRFGVSPVETQR